MLKYLVFMALFLLSATSFATTEEFVVQNIAVDVTGESAVEAQEKAFAMAEITAFQSLMQKMISSQDLGTVPAPTPDQIKSFITSFSVQDEKRSDIRYMANLQYRFDSVAIRKFLQAHNLTFSENLAHPILVVPFIDPSHGEELQELWQKAWDKLDLKKYNLSFISAHPTAFPKEFPLGNNTTNEHLRTLGQKHKTPHVALVRIRTEPNITLDPEESTPSYLDIYPSALIQPNYTIEIPFPSLKNMDIEKLIEAIHQGLLEIEKSHLAEKQIDQSPPQQTLELIVPTYTLDQWHKNLHIIQGVSGLLIRHIKSISKSTAHVIVQASDINHITQQLLQKGFQVVPYHGYLILRISHDNTKSS
jgi:hypothetical protein